MTGGKADPSYYSISRNHLSVCGHNVSLVHQTIYQIMSQETKNLVLILIWKICTLYTSKWSNLLNLDKCLSVKLLTISDLSQYQMKSLWPLWKNYWIPFKTVRNVKTWKGSFFLKFYGTTCKSSSFKPHFFGGKFLWFSLGRSQTCVAKVEFQFETTWPPWLLKCVTS